MALVLPSLWDKELRQPRLTWPFFFFFFTRKSLPEEDYSSINNFIIIFRKFQQINFSETLAHLGNIFLFRLILRPSPHYVTIKVQFQLLKPLKWRPPESTKICSDCHLWDTAEIIKVRPPLLHYFLVNLALLCLQVVWQYSGGIR